MRSGFTKDGGGAAAGFSSFSTLLAATGDGRLEGGDNGDLDLFLLAGGPPYLPPLALGGGDLLLRRMRRGEGDLLYLRPPPPRKGRGLGDLDDRLPILLAGGGGE